MEAKSTNCTNKCAYVKPSIEVIEMEFEGNILQSSAPNYGGGGGGGDW